MDEPADNTHAPGIVDPAFIRALRTAYYQSKKHAPPPDTKSPKPTDEKE